MGGPSRVVNNPGQVMRFTRCTVPTTLTKAAADQGYLLSFSLSQAIVPADFSSLFDQYRILNIELVFVWESASTVNVPIFYEAVDYDGSALAPTSASDAMTFSTCKIRPMSTQRPILSTLIRRPGTLWSDGAAAALVKRSPWIDMTTTTELHYGWNAWIAFFNSTTASGVLTYTARFDIECRQVR